MTNDEGRKPEGAPERSPKAGEGAPSGVDGNSPKRFSVQRKMAIVARLLRGEPLDLAMPAIQAAGEGYEVYAVTDASGDVSVEAHEMGVRRMMMAGVVPMNWLAVASEWQRDWARQDSARALGELVLPHTGATGTSFAWELQLLGQKTGIGA